MARNEQNSTGKNNNTGNAKVKDYSQSPFVLKKIEQALQTLEKFPAPKK